MRDEKLIAKQVVNIVLKQRQSEMVVLIDMIEKLNKNENCGDLFYASMANTYQQRYAAVDAILVKMAFRDFV